jgi:hypothetical protein
MHMYYFLEVRRLRLQTHGLCFEVLLLSLVCQVSRVSGELGHAHEPTSSACAVLPIAHVSLHETNILSTLEP